MFAPTNSRAHPSKLIAALVLASLLVVVSFGFATMTHNSGGSMETGCPFAVIGVPVCPLDLTGAAIHHISAYQSLLNAPVSFSMTVLLVALLLFVYGIFIFFVRPPASQPQLVSNLCASDISPKDREATSWLSLFEHSPSLI